MQTVGNCESTIILVNQRLKNDFTLYYDSILVKKNLILSMECNSATFNMEPETISVWALHATYINFSACAT